MSQELIHHIEIYVSDLEKSIDFWGWLLEELGCTVYQQWEKGKSWRLNGTYLVFVQAETAYIDAGYHRRRIGLNHLAFHASSPQQVDDLKKKLEDKGVPILYNNHYPYAGGEGHYALYFEDPDRIKVELVSLM